MAVISCSKVISPLFINVAPYLIRTRESGKVRREIYRSSVVINKHTQIQYTDSFTRMDFLFGEWAGPAAWTCYLIGGQSSGLQLERLT